VSAALDREPSLGARLREWRTAQGLGVSTLAARAGIARATLFSWESGAHQPRVPELSALLGALGATPGQREEVLALLDAPRALRAMRGSIAEADETLPATGQLLRAMRRRKGLTLAQVAEGMQVRPSTVCRWEAGEIRVPEERRPALFDLLAARPEERKALAAGIHFCLPPSREPATVEAIWVSFAQICERAARDEQRLSELEVLALDARLSPLAREDPAARELRLDLWSRHAIWLTWAGRPAEAADPARRILAAIRRDGRCPSYRQDVLHRALHTHAMSISRGEDPRGAARATESLLGWISVSSDVRWRSNICREIAEQASFAGWHDVALSFSLQACELAKRSEDAHLIYLARAVSSDVLLRAGRPRQALDFLLDSAEPSHPLNQILDALRWAWGLRALGDRASAVWWLERADALLGTHASLYSRATLEMIAREF
jgi:transcriptional regulator with XRE-family HTH domain